MKNLLRSQNGFNLPSWPYQNRWFLCNYPPWELKYPIKCKAKQIVLNCRLKYFRGRRFRVFVRVPIELYVVRFPSPTKKKCWEQTRRVFTDCEFFPLTSETVAFCCQPLTKNTKQRYFILLPRLIQSREDLQSKIAVYLAYYLKPTKDLIVAHNGH